MSTSVDRTETLRRSFRNGAVCCVAIVVLGASTPYGHAQTPLATYLFKVAGGGQTTELISGTADQPDKVGILSKGVAVSQIVTEFGKPDRIDKNEEEFFPTKKTGFGIFPDKGERWVYGRTTLFVKDELARQFGEWKDKPIEPAHAEAVTKQPQPQPESKTNTTHLLPGFKEELRGENPVRIRNPNNFTVTAGIRSGEKGSDLDVPPNGVNTVHIPNGRYDIYFVYSDKPDALFQGDSFTLSNNGVVIQIVKVVNGNYGIRQVK